MNKFNFFRQSGENNDDYSGDWDDVASYDEFEGRESSDVDYERVFQSAEKAVKYAEKYDEATNAGEKYAQYIIKQIQSGRMTREEGMAIYNDLKRKKAENDERTQVEYNERMKKERQYEANRKKNLLEKINQHPVAKKVVSGILAAGIIAAGFAASKRIMGSKGRGMFSITAYAESYDGGSSSFDDVVDENTDDEQDDTDDEIGEEAEAAPDGFEIMANGVVYARDAYFDTRRDKMYDFTNEFQEGYGDEEQTREALIGAVTKDPIYLAAVFSRLPDNFKGEYTGITSTVLANMVNGENGATLQKYMLDTIKDVVEKSEFDFGTLDIGNGGYNEYEIRDKGSESIPANVRLAERSLRESDNGRSMITVSLEDGEVLFEYLEECGNLIEVIPSMKEDGHVEITQEDTETPTPETPTPEDPTSETPTPEDPTPENPTPEDPTPEDPTPEDPTPEDPTPEDPTPEDPTPEDPTPEDPTPEDPTPEDPTPEDPTPEDHDDAKNPEQIEQNMQVYDESTNIVTPMDAGELSDRPVTDDEDNQYDEETNTFGDVTPEPGTGDDDGDGAVDSGNTQTGAQDTDLESADGSGNTIAENVEQADTSTVTDDGEKVADQENRTEEDKVQKQADEEAKAAQEQTNKEQEVEQQEAAQREEEHKQQQDIIDAGNDDDATDGEKEAAREAEEAQAREREEAMREIYRGAGYTEEEIDAMFGRS